MSLVHIIKNIPAEKKDRIMATLIEMELKGEI